jgi:hypothetical protein
MSDQKLRDLERRWRETGTVEDEAAYLLERMRVGELSSEKLELAAFCAHEGARRALGSDAPALPTEVEAWLIGLRDRSHHAALRAGLALAALALPEWEALHPSDSRPRMALDTVREVLAETEGSRESSAAAADEANDAAIETERDPNRASSAASCAAALADFAAGAFGMILDVYECARDALGPSWDTTAIRDTLRGEVVGWALEQRR